MIAKKTLEWHIEQGDGIVTDERASQLGYVMLLDTLSNSEMLEAA